MQKALSELSALSGDQLLELLVEPLLVTRHGEPSFVAQSLDSYEAMVRRIRTLEAGTRQSCSAISNSLSRPGKVIPLRPR
jgi:PHD/YefM family antitoxin component YafN of YafNO toxin-antitoxin module